MDRFDWESRKIELSEKIELARVRGRYLACVELVASVEVVRPRDRDSGWASDDALTWRFEPAERDVRAVVFVSLLFVSLPALLFVSLLFVFVSCESLDSG